MTMRRIALIAIAIGLLASLVVAVQRFRYERNSRSVEIVMDQQDFADFATAYGYDQTELLRQMRIAGLTAVAIYEETGQRINLGNHAFVQSGQQLIATARTTPLSDPLLAGLAKRGEVDPNSMYLLVYDRPTLDRYVWALRNQLESRNVRVLRSTLPALLAVKTQVDYFNNLGLGIPQDVATQARSLGLIVDPRFQNNEKLDEAHIQAVFDQAMAGGKIGTVIFFGLRNEVMGYQYQIDATADVFSTARANQPLFGFIEFYDPTQAQKGGETLGRKIPGRTVRVQAISKLELDKLDLDTVIARYLLGVRERNIRVIYLRPFPHLIQIKDASGQLVTASAEATNLEMLRQLRDSLSENGFHVGRAHPFVDFGGPFYQVLYFIAALGAAGGFLLLLDLLGWARAWMPWAFFGLTALAYAAAAFLHHDDIVRRAWALGGALTFSVLAGIAVAPWFMETTEIPGAKAPALQDARNGLRCLLTAAGVAAMGALLVTGLLSQASFMLEVQQFFGVKALLVVPALALVAIYLFTDAFGERRQVGDAAASPVRAWQLAAVVLLVAGAALLVTRSGNQPDTGVSPIEVHLRGFLTTLLGARPRFKEFLIGFPALFLLPVLLPAHRRALGWVFVLAIGVGTADIVDTFSHIHTSLTIGALRLFNGLVVGSLVGLVAQSLYRRLVRSPRPTRAA
jgi:Family of unknown function (DUF5693)